jgi:general secretion pathway protein E
MDDDIKSTILRTSDANAIKKVGVENGMSTLRMDGARKVLEGITTIEKMLPVFQDIAKRKTPAGFLLQGF